MLAHADLPELKQLGASQRIESHRRTAGRRAFRLGASPAVLSFHSALVHPDFQTSLIETSTVGSGISPDLLPCLSASARGLMRFSRHYRRWRLSLRPENVREAMGASQPQSCSRKLRQRKSAASPRSDRPSKPPPPPPPEGAAATWSCAVLVEDLPTAFAQLRE